MLTEWSASPTQGAAAGASPRLFIHRARPADGRPGPHVGEGLGERLGEARILFPQIVQVLPPLDLRFGAVATRAADLTVCFDGSATPVRVRALRPALLRYPEAAELAERNGSGGLFASTAGWMVALELASAVPLPAYAHPGPSDLVTHLDPATPATPAPGHPAPIPGPSAPPDGRPWWCKVFCLSGCGSC